MIPLLLALALLVLPPPRKAASRLKPLTTRTHEPSPGRSAIPDLRAGARPREPTRERDLLAGGRADEPAAGWSGPPMGVPGLLGGGRPRRATGGWSGLPAAVRGVLDGVRPREPTWGRSGSSAGVRGLRAGIRPRKPSPDPLAAAAAWDLLAAALRAGLPVARAVHAVRSGVPPGAAERLREVGDLLALGADPVTAWSRALGHPDTAPLARAARRTARSGAALAGAAADLASEVRAAVADRAEARAQRAAVLVAGPLALCFLPAFLCLGVLPVVIGLLGRMSESW